jgi:hypothetical protein
VGSNTRILQPGGDLRHLARRDSGFVQSSFVDQSLNSAKVVLAAAHAYFEILASEKCPLRIDDQASMAGDIREEKPSLLVVH